MVNVLGLQVDIEERVLVRRGYLVHSHEGLPVYGSREFVYKHFEVFTAPRPKHEESLHLRPNDTRCERPSLIIDPHRQICVSCPNEGIVEDRIPRCV